MAKGRGKMLKATQAVLLALLLLFPFSAQAAVRVEHVTAVTTAQSNLPPLVAERMNHSVAAIAGQLMEGKDLTAVQAKQVDYENLIHEVFDKVLVGYTVKNVTVYPAAVTKVQVELFPWSETIQQAQSENCLPQLQKGKPPEQSGSRP
jgi:hypothetical protein